MLEFRLLGPFEVWREDGQIAVGAPKQRALLALLVLARGEPVSTDRIIDALWGEQGTPSATNAIRVYVSNLRKALGNDELRTSPGGYLVASESVSLDSDRFATLAADARAALDDEDPHRARELLSEAFALWRGDPLADLAYESFARSEIARLDELRQRAVEDRIEAELALGQHRNVVAELEATVARYPQRERPLAQLMLALYRSGRQADALESYRMGRRALLDELGLEPGRELRELEQRILAQDPTLDVSVPPSSRPAGPKLARSRNGRRLVAVGGAVVLAAAVVAAIDRSRGSAHQLRVEANAVAVIDPKTGRVSAAVPAGARPGPLAFGANALWVANLDDHTITKIDAATLQAVRAISLPALPTGVAADDRNVWVSTSSPTATQIQVSHIDPAFDAIDRSVSVGNAVPGTAAPLADGAGTVWIAPFAGELTKLDAQTGAEVGRLDPNAAPSDVAVDANVAWVTDGSADTVTRVDPTGLTSPIPVGNRPTGIVTGFGYVWATDTEDGTVVRIDPTSRSVDATVRVGATPRGIAAGAGAIWVADSGDGTVDRIDPASGRVSARIEVGGSPQDVAVGAGRVWVTVAAQTITASPTPGGTLRIVSLGDDVSSMDPALADDATAAQLLDTTCVRLLNYPDLPGLAGERLAPEVAQALPQRSADGRTYTFTLRSGFRFSEPSNAPVTAATFQYAIERTLNPRTHSPNAWEGQDIVGAGAYMTGKASHISGIHAQGNVLSITLIAPAPDILSRLDDTPFCAVPLDTPITPQGVRVIPSAGPYRVLSYTPGQGIVLVRNTSYAGGRPHVLDRIELQFNVSNARAAADVEQGTADYAVSGVPSSAAAPLAAEYGPNSTAARSGHQQYFINPLPQLDFFDLNSTRPLFGDVRMRQAVNYAIDRTALAQLGDEYLPLPERVATHYLPPTMLGYAGTQVYPVTPDVADARRLARHPATRTVVLYTCDVSPCDAQAQIIKTDLAAIGLDVQVHEFPDSILFTKTTTPGEPFDMAWVGWLAVGQDPGLMLNSLLVQESIVPPLNDPPYQRLLAAAEARSGPDRYLGYENLDLDLARNAAPLAAFGNLSSVDFFSRRIGCQVYGAYGMDLNTLCTRH